LDALNPTVIANLVREQIEPLIQRNRWKAAQAKERRGRTLLTAVAKQFDQV
jgi:hypothetical protein